MDTNLEYVIEKRMMNIRILKDLFVVKINVFFPSPLWLPNVEKWPNVLLKSCGALLKRTRLRRKKLFSIIDK